MPTIVQFRRGTEAQSDAFTGNVGELSVDTTNATVRVHDGSTAGGSRLATHVDVTDRIQVANATSLFVNVSGDTMSGALAMGTYKITGMGDPISDQDAATKTYVDTAVANIVDSAPAALDTLNELAAALSDDASFSTTITTSIGEKLVKASNLSDLTDTATARTNLGLGNAAVVDATNAATANKVVQRDGSGDFSANIITAVDFNATSDGAMKTNISTITSSLEKIDAIRGVNFNWKNDNRYAMGVIAQEVEAVIPEVVKQDNEGFRSVNYGALVGLLIEAVKDLKNEVDELKANK